MAEEFLNQISAKCSVIIIGAGQAGLSIAHSLQKKGIKPLILEKNYVGFSWKEQRWDSFCLVTPNWQCTLPDYQYSGKAPNGFMDKENIVKYLKKYSEFVKADILEGIEVKHLVKKNEKFLISTNRGNFEADQVVIATGAYHVPNRHPHSERLPSNILQIDAREYKNAISLPEGPVLVVGSGQSGCQIAEDLFFEKREVHLSVGSAPRSPRRYRGRDVVDWLDRMGYYSMPIGEHDDPKSVRNKTNHYLTGRDNGREIDLRKRATEGMNLHGRLERLAINNIQFSNDLSKNLDGADSVYCRIRNSIDEWISKNGIDAPKEAKYTPFWEPNEDVKGTKLECKNLAVVIWCTGYKSDFRWVDIPVFDGAGIPVHERGVTQSPGLYFLGLPWLYTWGSGRFCGVKDDANYLADIISLRTNKSAAAKEMMECKALLGS